MAIAAVATVVAAVISAYAQYQSAQSQAAAQDYQAKVARNQAIQSRQAAEVAAHNARERHERVLAAQRARLGAAGVSSSEGSPLIVQMASAEEAALEEARIRYGGAVRAQGFENERTLLKFQARQTRAAGTLAAGTTLLTGAAGAYGSYSKSRQGTAGAGTSTMGDTVYIQRYD